MAYTIRKILAASSYTPEGKLDPATRVKLINEWSDIQKILQSYDKQNAANILKTKEMTLDHRIAVAKYVAEIEGIEGDIAEADVQSLTTMRKAAIDNMTAIADTHNRDIDRLIRDTNEYAKTVSAGERNTAAWQRLIDPLLGFGQMLPWDVKGVQDYETLTQIYGNPSDAFAPGTSGYAEAKKLEAYYGRVKNNKLSREEWIASMDASLKSAQDEAVAQNMEGAREHVKEAEKVMSDFFSPEALAVTPESLQRDVAIYSSEQKGVAQLQDMSDVLAAEIKQGSGDDNRLLKNMATALSNDGFQQYAVEHGYDVGKGGFDENGKPWYAAGKDDGKAIMQYAKDGAKDPLDPTRRWAPYAPRVKLIEHREIPVEAAKYKLEGERYAFVDEYYDHDRNAWIPFSGSAPVQVADADLGTTGQAATRRRYLTPAEVQERRDDAGPVIPSSGITGDPQVWLTNGLADDGTAVLFVKSADYPGRIMKARSDGVLVAATLTEAATVEAPGQWGVVTTADKMAYAPADTVMVLDETGAPLTVRGSIMDKFYRKTEDWPEGITVILPEEVDEIRKAATAEAGGEQLLGVTFTNKPPDTASTDTVSYGTMHTVPVPGGKQHAVFTGRNGEKKLIPEDDEHYTVETVRGAGKARVVPSFIEMARSNRAAKKTERADRAEEGSLESMMFRTPLEGSIERARQKAATRQAEEGSLPEDRAEARADDREQQQDLKQQATTEARATDEEITQANIETLAGQEAELRAEAADATQSAAEHREQAELLRSEAAAQQDPKQQAKLQKEARRESGAARSDERQAIRLGNDAIRALREKRKLKVSAGEAGQVEIDELKDEEQKLQQDIADNEALPPDERSDMTAMKSRLARVQAARQEAEAGMSPKPKPTAERMAADATIPTATVEGQEAVAAEREALEGERERAVETAFEQWVANEAVQAERRDPEAYADMTTAKAAILANYDLAIQDDIQARYDKMVAAVPATGQTPEALTQMHDEATRRARLGYFAANEMAPEMTPGQRERVVGLKKAEVVPEGKVPPVIPPMTEPAAAREDVMKAPPVLIERGLSVLQSRLKKQQEDRAIKRADEDIAMTRQPTEPSGPAAKKTWPGSVFQNLKEKQAERKRKREEEEAAAVIQSVDVVETAAPVSPP